MNRSLVLLPLAVAVMSAPAWAGKLEEAQAEHTRLSEQMRRLAKRAAWGGVDDSYVKMLALVEQGVVLGYDDHYLGAEAAKALGDINSTYRRLLRARDADKTTDVVTWIKNIEASYAPVEIKVDDKFSGEFVLNIAMLPMAPDQRAAIQAAQAIVAENRSYSGLLPRGDYTLGERNFTVNPGPTLVSVHLEAQGKPPKPPKPTIAKHQGIHVNLGGGYLGASGESLGAAQISNSSTDGTLDDAAGAGLRLGVGFELGLNKAMGAKVEFGVQTLVAASAPDAQLGMTAEAPSLTLFGGWLAGTYWIDSLGFALGPTWSLAPSAQSTITLADGTQTTASTMLMAGGGAVGIFYGFADLPIPGSQASQLGVALHAGAHLDGIQTLPWAQVAVGIGPGNLSE